MPDTMPAILQFRVWLKGLSPMVWRRVQVPATMTLREFHGVLQVAMGWEGIHLYQFVVHTVRYGSWQLTAGSPDIGIDALRGSVVISTLIHAKGILQVTGNT